MTTHRADGWKIQSAFPWMRPTRLAPAEKQSWPNSPKCYLSRPCGPTSQIFPPTKQVGWPAPAMRRSEKRWRSCTEIPRNRGRLLLLQKKRECHDLYLPNDFAI